MSKPEDKKVEPPKPQPNPLGFLDVRRSDEKANIIRDLITSDKNNPTKARIPNIFGMVVFRVLGRCATPTKTIDYVIGSEKISVPKTVAGLEQFFYDSYNIISMSLDGKSREEYERAASSWLAQQSAIMQTAQSARIEEGAKGKQK